MISLGLQALLFQHVLCDVYFPVFVGFAGNKESVYEAWIGPSMRNDIPRILGQNKRQNHLRNHFIDHWTGVKQVKLELFNNNERVMWLKFNGNGTDNLSWFSKENLEDSSFNDLAPCSTFNYFSLEGEARAGSNPLDRKFFINRSYGGCAEDAGWFCIADKHQHCPWEKRGAPPSFIYTINNTPRKYDTGMNNTI